VSFLTLVCTTTAVSSEATASLSANATTLATKHKKTQRSCLVPFSLGKKKQAPVGLVSLLGHDQKTPLSRGRFHSPLLPLCCPASRASRSHAELDSRPPRCFRVRLIGLLNGASGKLVKELECANRSTDLCSNSAIGPRTGRNFISTCKLYPKADQIGQFEPPASPKPLL
jgi:hypothetical protein